MNMKTRITIALMVALALTAIGATMMATQAGQASNGAKRPKGPCDIYAAAGDPCVAAHSTTRALYAAYTGPLYQVLRQSDGKTLDVGVVAGSASPTPDPGGYANAAAQDAFCANTYCWITTIYDQSPKHNDLIQAPRGGFSGPAMGGFNNLPVADMAPVTLMGHKVYGVFIAPGMGLRQNDTKGTAVDDQAEGQYWVISGHHYNSGCCFDYGNAETDSRDDDNGTMETTYYGNATAWYRGSGAGPWVMTDQENNLVGCVNADGSKLCEKVPSITWRFVTAIAKGEPHHWTSMGGDAQKGDLKVMFDGPRIDHTYDPMRKQGAILLGNGGDNSVGSQGTFYEGAMTAAGTFPTDATDQLVQANVVAAKYDVAPLGIAPASALAAPPGLQTFTPGSSQETTVTFTNTSGAPAAGVTLSLAVPARWTSVVKGAAKAAETIPGPVAPGASASATFKVTSGPIPFNGDLVARASWKTASGATRLETVSEKVRTAPSVTINEFRINAGSPANSTDSFIELHNASSKPVDISNWSLTQHQAQQAIFSSVKIPAGTKVAAGGFYLLGLANSGLVASAKAGDKTLYVRSTAGMNAGDSITIDTGVGAETRKIASVGTAAGNQTTLWQPLPDGPVITMPVGSTNVPVTSASGFAVGEKVALGHGAAFPSVARTVEQYEVATVTAVGKPGTQAWLGVDAPAGASNIKVTSTSNISAGDTIRLDINSVGYGIETVTVTSVGTPAVKVQLSMNAIAGATNLIVRPRGSLTGFTVGEKMTVGNPANQETVTITAVGAPGANGVGIDFKPALRNVHLGREDVVAHGSGLGLSAPLKFKHAANMPFSARGTGITFTPATTVAHTSNEPVQPLGTGITLDQPLAKAHAIDAVVRDATVATAGYQGTPAPNQWFGGPAFSTSAGAMVLRDGAGLVVDSLNYGLLVDPWAAEGYQAASGAGESGCRVPVPAGGRGFGGFGGGAAPAVATPHRSAGRFPDGRDTDSNCNDFLLQVATTLSAEAAAGTTNVKVAGVADFAAGQAILIDGGANLEKATIASVGTAGATAVASAVAAGATVIPVASGMGFAAGQTITIDGRANQETAVVAATGRGGPGGPGGPGGATITITTPLKSPHAAGAQVSGSGITLAAPLTKAHASGTPVAVNVPTPGAPNQYVRSGRGR
jgi:non-reducing end alpha-L-arabinofuranosidase